jgi:O-antigen biosynthesis protein
MPPAVAALVLYYDAPKHIKACLQSLTSNAASIDELIIVDNGSKTAFDWTLVDGARPATLARLETNQGVAGGFNAAIRSTKADMTVLITQDVVLHPNAISNFLSALERYPEVSVAGSKLLYPQGNTIQHAGACLSYPLALPTQRGNHQEDQGQFQAERFVPYVTGAFFALRRSLLPEQPFDERYFPAYYEDSDMALSAWRAGSRVLYVPGSVAEHVGSTSLGRNSFDHLLTFHANRLRFILKWLAPRRMSTHFLPAEAIRTRAVGNPVERRALRRAYGIAMAAATDEAKSALSELLNVAAPRANNPTDEDETELETAAWTPVECWLEQE